MLLEKQNQVMQYLFLHTVTDKWYLFKKVRFKKKLFGKITFWIIIIKQTLCHFEISNIENKLCHNKTCKCYILKVPNN